MKAENPVEVLNLDGWLPGHGETSVDLHTQGLELVVSIGYDGPDDIFETRTLTFHKVCSFERGLFPGVKTLNIEFTAPFPDGLSLSSVFEYKDSEMAQAWVEHFDYYKAVVKHYRILFLGEKFSLTVFASGFTLSDPIATPLI